MPPKSVCDVTFWLNFLLDQRHQQSSQGNLTDGLNESVTYAAINTAVEATTLNERSWIKLRSQDVFIRDNIRSEDVLIVSIGGNDIALAPTPCTIFSMAGLLCLPESCVNHGKSYCAVPVSKSENYAIPFF